MSKNLDELKAKYIPTASTYGRSQSEQYQVNRQAQSVTSGLYEISSELRAVYQSYDEAQWCSERVRLSTMMDNTPDTLAGKTIQIDCSQRLAALDYILQGKNIGSGW